MDRPAARDGAGGPVLRLNVSPVISSSFCRPTKQKGTTEINRLAVSSARYRAHFTGTICFTGAFAGMRVTRTRDARKRVMTKF